jgi:hypothetical protein
VKLAKEEGKKITCSPSYVDYRPKTNAVILLDTVTHQGENVHGSSREREGNLKLEYDRCAPCCGVNNVILN